MSFDPFTGASLDSAVGVPRSPSARAGLEAPRFCEHCGRRMIVRVNPMGWVATCSRHGDVDSARSEREKTQAVP